MLKQNELKTEVYYLPDILELIENGSLRVPKFQRLFVWDEQQMLDLFESIAKDYPIGSLLFWKTDKKYKSLNKIGAFQIPEDTQNNNTYIIDGHQRLSTLFGALSKPSSENYSKINNNWKWEIYYDLENQEFFHIRNKLPKDYQVPIYTMYDTFEFLATNKKLQIKFPEKSETYIKRLEKFFNLIRKYKIATIQIKSNDLNQAIEIFSKLNSTGDKITPVQMYEALTYKEDGFNLTEEIENIQHKLNLLHFELDSTFVFRSILSMLDVDIYKHNIEKLSKNSNIDLKKGISHCIKALKKAIDFLVLDLGIFIRPLLPYKLQLIYLGVFFNKCADPNPEQKELLKKWFWRSTYTGYFASTHSRMVQDGLSEMKSLADGNLSALSSLEEMGDVQKFPNYYNTRSVRVKAFILFLNSLQPKSLLTENELPLAQLYIEYGLGVVSNFFPKVQKRANKFICNPKEKNDFDKRCTKEVLKSNALSQESYEEFLIDKNDSFFKLREEDIKVLEEKFIAINIA